MTLASSVTMLDGVLKPLGFRRRRHVWNRRVDRLTDVVTAQASKSQDAFTINVGILVPEAYAACWGTEPPAFVNEASCTVSRRLSFLTSGHDKWWQQDDSRGPSEVAELIRSHGVPFIERLHDSVALLQELHDEVSAVTQPYPPRAISLAVLMAAAGQRHQACRVLHDLVGKPIGAWRGRAEAVKQDIGCSA